MNTDKLVELFKKGVEKLEKEAYERGKRDALKVDNLKTVKRKAKVGERVLVVDAKPLYTPYTNGDIYKVKDLDVIGVDIDRNGTQLYLYHDEYEVIIEEPVQPLSANQQRKELIEQAREFVESQKNAMGTYEVKDPSSPHAPWHCDVEFIVNEEKRTVVALLRGFNIPTLYAKGIAKCHPDEVFNADIGKAIALARALEIDVPDEFLNAVQPDEVVVGMVVYTASFMGNATVCDKTSTFNKTVRPRTFNDLTFCDIYGMPKIISDTNAKYEVV